MFSFCSISSLFLCVTFLFKQIENKFIYGFFLFFGYDKRTLTQNNLSILFLFLVFDFKQRLQIMPMNYLYFDFCKQNKELLRVLCHHLLSDLFTIETNNYASDLRPVSTQTNKNIIVFTSLKERLKQKAA